MGTKHLTAWFLVSAAFVVNGRAQSTGTSPDAAGTQSGGLQDYLARTVKLQGSFRARWEAPQGSDFTVTPADSFLLTRLRLGVAFQPTPWIRLFAETQDARAEFYQATPSSSVTDPLDFRQGYVEAGRLEGNGVKVRIGRQDLNFGASRLITSGDWSNVTKSFDIVRGTLTASAFKLDLIAGSPLLYDTTRMDRHKPGEHFYVAYAVFSKLIPNAVVEPYFMAKTAMNCKSKDNAVGNADTLYGGLRIAGKAPFGFDYTAEAVREGGDYGSDVIQAWGYVAGGGWTHSLLPWKLHASSDYLWASGDSGRKDGHHQSFDYLYGSNQPLNGLTGMFCWRNLAAWRAGADFSPHRRVKVKIDFRDYWLATVQDGLYNAIGVRTVLNAKATSSHVGEGVDAQVTTTITPKTSLGVGVGNLAPGSYLYQSGKTSGFVYPYLVFSRLL